MNDEFRNAFKSTLGKPALQTRQLFVGKRRYQILICLRKHLNPGRGERSLQMSMVAGMAKLIVASAGSKGTRVVFNFSCCV